MHNAANALKSNSKLVLTLVAGCALAVTMLVGALTQVAATPEYARQTGLPCGQCHVSPAGGGKLNTFGEKFREHGNKVPDK